MTRNETKKRCQSRCVYSWQTRKTTVILGFQCETQFNDMNIRTQAGINSQLRTHSILSPFVTCTPYKTSLWILGSCVSESPRNMQLLSHYAQIGCNLWTKSTSSFFPSRKDLLGKYWVSRRHCLPTKDMHFHIIHLMFPCFSLRFV